MLALESSNYRPTLIHSFYIKPLSVIKQVIVMMMSADKGKFLCSIPELRKFILDRNEKNLSSRYRVYMYYTKSAIKRFIGYSVLFDERGINRWSEVSFEPFGFIFTDDSPPAHPAMMDITYFRSYDYDQQDIVNLQLPHLPVLSPMLADLDYTIKKVVSR